MHEKHAQMPSLGPYSFASLYLDSTCEEKLATSGFLKQNSVDVHGVLALNEPAQQAAA